MDRVHQLLRRRDAIVVEWALNLVEGDADLTEVRELIMGEFDDAGADAPDAGAPPAAASVDSEAPICAVCDRAFGSAAARDRHLASRAHRTAVKTAKRRPPPAARTRSEASHPTSAGPEPPRVAEPA